MELECAWSTSDQEYLRYHDEEWGVPLRSDPRLFEMLVLEGSQAGLSWITVLRRRSSYRVAFEEFDISRVAKLDPQRLIEAPGLIRNRKKIVSAIHNAQIALKIQAEVGSLSQYLWSFIDDETIVNGWRKAEEVPSYSARSVAMSQGLRSYGMSFVGPTICYAFMQAVGMVNDHLMSCPRYKELGGVLSGEII